MTAMHEMNNVPHWNLGKLEGVLSVSGGDVVPNGVGVVERGVDQLDGERGGIRGLSRPRNRDSSPPSLPLPIRDAVDGYSRGDQGEKERERAG